MAQITLYPTEDARLYSPNLGAGKSLYLPIGLYSGDVYRSVLKFSMPNWSGLGISRITGASFKCRQTSQNYIARGSQPRFYVRRLTASFGDEGTSVGLSTSNNVVYPGSGSTGTGQVDSGTLPDSNENTVTISILTMFRLWAPTYVENGGGLTHYGIELRSFDEASTSRTTEIYSREASVYDPRIVVDYETNTAPAAPVNRSPVSDADGNPTIALKSGVYAAFTFTRSDPDSGDYITNWDVEIYPDSTTDGTASLINRIITASQPGGYSTADVKTTTTAYVDVSALTPGTTYRWRVRTYDQENAVGAWSTLADARIIPNTAPGAPATPSVDPNSITPNFYGSIVDPDAGATISGVQVQVYQDTGAGAIAKWDDDPDLNGDPYIASSGTRFTVAYSGASALEFGVKYRYRSRIRDNVGSWGAWTNWIEWTPSTVTGPTALSPISVETKLNTLSPTMTIGHGAAFDQYEVEVYRYNDLTSTRHYASGTQSVASTTSTTKVVGPLPDWGRTYYWRARVRPTGGGAIANEAWSPLYPIYVNALPVAPVLTLG